MFKMIIILLTILYVAYMITILLHICGLAKFTKRKITALRLLIPFYYWIAK